ncbi:hypothetical protein ACLB2K_021953 [Fragaria x ananassa]
MKMMLKSLEAFSSCSHFGSTRGMPFLHSTLALHNFMALFHSQPSNPIKSVRDVEHTLNVFKGMLHMRPLPPLVCFNQLLAQLVKLEHYDVVISLFKQMGLMGIPYDSPTLSILANCYCYLNQAQAPGLGLSVLPHFFKLGLQPDVTTFTALIKVFLLQTAIEPKTSNPKVNYLDFALKMFHEMLHLRPLPSVIPFNRILSQLVKLKQYSAFISLNRQMLLRRIVPDDYTLNILINCYCHLNQMGFSLSVLGNFFKLGLQPDVITFNTLIHGFVLEIQVAEAALIFTKMLEGGHCKPNVVTFN